MPYQASLLMLARDGLACLRLPAPAGTWQQIRLNHDLKPQHHINAMPRQCAGAYA